MFDHTQISGNSDTVSLEAVQLRTRFTSVLNFHFWGLGQVELGLSPKLKTVIAQLRQSQGAENIHVL